MRFASGVVVVLTALDLEHEAVHAHLTDVQRIRVRSGTGFRVGRLATAPVWIALAATGEGNVSAAVLAERAIAEFRPLALLFVGVAGGLDSEIQLGDVVVATRLYAYHGGVEEGTESLARPRTFEAPHELLDLARDLARSGSWATSGVDRVPRSFSIHFKPVAAGEVVARSAIGATRQRLRSHFNDAAAIEMEGAGVAQAAHLNDALPLLVVRGISDQADESKSGTDAVGMQQVAASNAAAFAMALICALTETNVPDVSPGLFADGVDPPLGLAPGLVYSSLPMKSPVFTGRAREISWIAAQAAAATDSTRVVAINGMPGVGKTTLAIHVAHQLAERFPDRQLFVDLQGFTQGGAPSDSAVLLASLLRGDGLHLQSLPTSVDELSSLWRSRMASRRVLLVLDNAASSAQVAPLLLGGRRCLVLVTSRRHLGDLPCASSQLTLDVLPPGESADLFVQLAPRAAVQSVDSITQLARIVGYLPLALSVLAAVYTNHESWTIADLIRETVASKLTLTPETLTVTAAFYLSYQTLPPDRQSFFRLLGLHPGPLLDSYAAAALAGIPPEQAQVHLDALHAERLVVEPSYRRYGMHDLVRDYSRALTTVADSVDQRDAALSRLFDYYQHTAQRASARRDQDLRPKPSGLAPAYAPEFAEPDAAFRWLRAERANLLACLDLATQEDWGERVVALSAGLANMMITDGPWPDAVGLHAAAAQTAQRLRDRAGQADALTDLGGVRLLAGDPQGAVRDLNQALDLYAGLGDRRGRANALTELGQARVSSGDHIGATRDLQEALELYTALSIRLGRARALARLGYIWHMTGDYPGAIGAYEESLGLHREAGAGLGLANTLTRLALVQQSTGNHREAIANLQEALELYRALDNRLGQSTALVQLGQARLAGGDQQAAIGNLEQALELCRAVGSVPAEGNTLIALGNVRRLAGDLAGAARDLEAGLAICRAIGFRANEGWAMNYYAAVFLAGGDLPRALAVYQDALKLSREVEHPDDEALALEGIGECRLRSAEPEAGADHLNQALAIFRRLGMQPDAARVAARLAESDAPQQ